jgi:hypothetical protein
VAYLYIRGDVAMLAAPERFVTIPAGEMNPYYTAVFSFALSWAGLPVRSIMGYFPESLTATRERLILVRQFYGYDILGYSYLPFFLSFIRDGDGFVGTGEHGREQEAAFPPLFVREIPGLRETDYKSPFLLLLEELVVELGPFTSLVDCIDPFVADTGLRRCQ